MIPGPQGPQGQVPARYDAAEVFCAVHRLGLPMTKAVTTLTRIIRQDLQVGYAKGSATTFFKQLSDGKSTILGGPLGNSMFIH